MTLGYDNAILAELAKQLTGGLLRLRRGYMDAAEELLTLIAPDREYPYEFVLYRLTGYRPAGGRPIQPLAGAALARDLRRLILDLSDSVDLPADSYDQRVFDTAALARHFQVATKTVQRWRRAGLVTRKLVFPDGGKRLAFLASSVRAFVRPRRRQILRSIRFSQMAPADREGIVRSARDLVAATGCGLYEAARTLASRTGRAVETLRYTLRNHDRAHPERAVFPDADGPVSPGARRAIYQAFLRGVTVAALTRRYHRTRGSIYRIVNAARAEALQTRPIEYLYNPAFDLPEAEDLILQDIPATAPEPAPAVPPGTPPYLASLYGAPLLTGPQERGLFQQYNYLKHRADTLRKGLDPRRPRARTVRAVERLLAQADALKHRLIRCNLRLVVSIARRHAGPAQDLFELISDGNLTLMRAVEKFDYARGNRFSTYATWAIVKNFARSVPREKYLLDRFRTGQPEVLELAGPVANPDVHLADLRESLEVVLAQLSPRERAIVTGHYGLADTQGPQSLDQLSRQLGLSKERLRQIERGAMAKLRGLLEPNQAQLLE